MTRVKKVVLASILTAALAGCGNQNASPETAVAASSNPAAAASESPQPPPEQLSKALAALGYEVQDGSTESTNISQDEAVARAIEFGAPRDVTDIYLGRVTTPRLGELSDAADPESDVKPTFSDNTMWLVVSTAQVEMGGAHAYVPPEQKAESKTQLVEQTVITFVDAITGETIRAVAF